MKTVERIVSILRFFSRNLRAHGNIFGLREDTIPMGTLSKLNMPSSCSIFFSLDTLLSAWKQVLVAKMAKERILPNQEILSRLIRNSEVTGRALDVLGDYQSIIRNMSNVAKKLGVTGTMIYPRSTGIELYVFGLEDIFYSAAEGLASSISESGAEEIVVYSPIEHLALSMVDSKYRLGVKLTPFLRILSDNISRVRIAIPRGTAFQESCIHSRWLGIKDYAEGLFDERVGLIRHPLSGTLTTCCGEHIWICDPEVAVRNAAERLISLSHVGRGNVCVACPSALYLFRAAIELYPDDLKDVKLFELSSLVEVS